MSADPPSLPTGRSGAKRTYQNISIISKTLRGKHINRNYDNLSNRRKASILFTLSRFYAFTLLRFHIVFIGIVKLEKRSQNNDKRLRRSRESRSNDS